MKAKAIATNVHQSPRKMRKTLNSIRGLKVGDAMNMLHFSPEKAASIIEKTLRSAVANLMQKMDDTHLDPETLGIDEAFVNGTSRTITSSYKSFNNRRYGRSIKGNYFGSKNTSSWI